ncbi:zinc ribbon domain-containing protein YjdM [Arthrobacter sulfonylureivorans]|uniref:zinc ribbon domain-containing protein YjdM n=1 Tax=Arthrobacter sulfonylureivorans TaxID=2486855 RepID=UPI0039E2731F
MSDALPACPECHEAYTYEQGALLVCPMCGHEWPKDSAETTVETTVETTPEAAHETALIKDAVGNVLADGDTVTIVKDLKVKGAGGGVMKVGTKVRGIRLIEDGVGDHDIDATVPGFGRMQLKSSVVKKVL